VTATGDTPKTELNAKKKVDRFFDQPSFLLQVRKKNRSVIMKYCWRNMKYLRYEVSRCARYEVK